MYLALRNINNKSCWLHVFDFIKNLDQLLYLLFPKKESLCYTIYIPFRYNFDVTQTTFFDMRAHLG
jgi:hypothetical protein